MLNSINIKDFMSVNPLTFAPATHIMDAIHEMLVRKVTGGTVLDDQGRVVGVISELDLFRVLAPLLFARLSHTDILFTSALFSPVIL